MTPSGVERSGLRSQSPAPHSGAARVPPAIVRLVLATEPVAAWESVIVAPVNVTGTFTGAELRDTAERLTVSVLTVIETPFAVAPAGWLSVTPRLENVRRLKFTVVVAALLRTTEPPEKVIAAAMMVWSALVLIVTCVGLSTE